MGGTFSIAFIEILTRLRTNTSVLSVIISWLNWYLVRTWLGEKKTLFSIQLFVTTHVLSPVFWHLWFCSAHSIGIHLPVLCSFRHSWSFPESGLRTERMRCLHWNQWQGASLEGKKSWEKWEISWRWLAHKITVLRLTEYNLLLAHSFICRRC